MPREFPDLRPILERMRRAPLLCYSLTTIFPNAQLGGTGGGGSLTSHDLAGPYHTLTGSVAGYVLRSATASTVTLGHLQASDLAAGAGPTVFLRGDMVWATPPSGSGTGGGSSYMPGGW